MNKNTIELIKELSYLENEIEIKIFMYNKKLNELNTKRPDIKDNGIFKKKILNKKR